MPTIAEPLHLEYDVLPKDHANALYAHYGRDRRGRVLFPMVGASLLVVGFLLAFTSRDWSPLWIAGLGAWFLCGTAQFNLRIRRDKKLARHWSAGFSDDGITYVSSSSRSEVKWNNYTHFVDADEFILMYQSRLQFHFIPKRDLSSAELERLQQLMASHGIPEKRPANRVWRTALYSLLLAVNVVIIVVVLRSYLAAR